MAAGGIKIWLKRKRASFEPKDASEQQQNPNASEKTTPDKTRES